jgi:hypothetical protein
MKITSIFLILLFVAAACGGASQSQVGCSRDPASGFERCYESNNYGEAAVNTGVAAALWGATGCTINGCQPPDLCNKESKVCERPRCETDSGCPYGFHCDLSARRCK